MKIGIKTLIEKLQKLSGKKVILERFSDEEIGHFIDQTITIKGDKITYKGNLTYKTFEILANKYSNYTLDVIGNVYIFNRGYKEMPIQFGEVTGDFKCYNNKLTSLKNFPIEVGGKIDCSGNLKKFSEKDIKKICNVKGEIWN